MSEPKPRVCVEFIAWATIFVGGDGSERVVLEEEIGPGETLRTVLKRLSARHPDLNRALWAEGSEELGEHIEVAVNDSLLGVRHHLDSEIKDGDAILLMGQYMGG